MRAPVVKKATDMKIKLEIVPSRVDSPSLVAGIQKGISTDILKGLASNNTVQFLDQEKK